GRVPTEEADGRFAQHADPPGGVGVLRRAGLRDPVHDQPGGAVLLLGLRARARVPERRAGHRLAHPVLPAAHRGDGEPGARPRPRGRRDPDRARTDRLPRRRGAALLVEDPAARGGHGRQLPARPPPPVWWLGGDGPRHALAVAALPRAGGLRDDAVPVSAARRLGGGPVPGAVRRRLPRLPRADWNVPAAPRLG